MKNYVIDFTVTLSTSRAIQADSPAEAVRIAELLLENDDYRQEIIASWDDPDSGWGEPDTPTWGGYVDDLPEMSIEDYENLLGFNPWED